MLQTASEESKVLVVPALTGLGAPYWDANARGAIFGLTRDTGKEDITKATLESITYQSKDLVQSMKRDRASFEKLMIDGGMVANDWFCQKLSNVLEVEVERPQIIETTSLGAAFLAGLASGFWKSTKDLEKLWKEDYSFEPNPDDNTKSIIRLWENRVPRVLS